jgi:hypothetical protein
MNSGLMSELQKKHFKVTEALNVVAEIQNLTYSKEITEISDALFTNLGLTLDKKEALLKLL